MQKPTSIRIKTLIVLMAALGATWSSCKKEHPVHPHEAPIRPVTAQSNAYVTQLFQFNPAPGQFINTTTADTVAAGSILNAHQGLVSLGAYGGFIVLGFDHTVLDSADTPDLIVYGNGGATSAEPGVIWVMQDANGNGKPDDTWYELSGSETGKAGYIRNYAITYTRPAGGTGDIPWKDNQGNNGVVKSNTFHKQSYFPIGIKDSTYTLTGTLLPSTNINSTNPNFITSASFAFGYADNTSGGDKVDITNAIDDKGNKVSLKGIDFIKIQTGIQYNMGWLGELSTEVTGVADLNILKN